MSLRSRSIQIARTALRKELLPLSSASSAWQRSLVAKNNMSVVPASSSSYSVDFLTLRSFSTKPEDTAVEEEPAAAADETNTGADEPTDASSSESADGGTDKAIADLEQQVKDLKDNLLRSLAEQENTRRIAKRDVEQARSFAISSFAKSLLETSDNLSRALDAVPEELRHDHDHHPVLATLYEGITMTDDGLTKAFTKNGLEKFGVAGEKFDPNLHEGKLSKAHLNGDNRGVLPTVRRRDVWLSTPP